LIAKHLGWQGAGYKKEDWAELGHRDFFQFLAIIYLERSNKSGDATWLLA